MGEFVRENPLVLLIGGAEIAFWVFVTASPADVATGTPPGLVHGLAAIYLGVTVALGPSIVRWPDVRFAHRLPVGRPRSRNSAAARRGPGTSGANGRRWRSRG